LDKVIFDPPVTLVFIIAPRYENIQMNTPKVIVVNIISTVAIISPLNIADTIPCTLLPNSRPSDPEITFTDSVVSKLNTIPANANPRISLPLPVMLAFNLFPQKQPII
jgi:hypothetical protein